MKKSDIEALKCCAVFNNADEKLLTELISNSEYRKLKYTSGEDIFTPTHYEKGLAVILKGKAEVWKHTGEGDLYMSLLSEGNCFGMSCVFSEKDSFPTTVTAKTDVRLLFITKAQLEKLFRSEPVILESFLRILSNKIHFLNEKIDKLSAPQVSSALRSYLTDTAQKLNSSTFTLPVSYQKLALLLSIGRTSLYRAFDELTKEGFLTKNGKVITINLPLERKETL